MHAEPINDQLVKENVPGDERVNTFDEWAAYTRSNAIVSPAVLPPSHRSSKHNSLLLPFSAQSTFHPIGTAALAPEYLRGGYQKHNI
jgi:hypothetical protein